ncbi:hypothetical protein ACJX0J_011063, partial [Zea mays]
MHLLAFYSFLLTCTIMKHMHIFLLYFIISISILQFWETGKMEFNASAFIIMAVNEGAVIVIRDEARTQEMKSTCMLTSVCAYKDRNVIIDIGITYAMCARKLACLDNLGL